MISYAWVFVISSISVIVGLFLGAALGVCKEPEPMTEEQKSRGKKLIEGMDWSEGND